MSRSLPNSGWDLRSLSTWMLVIRRHQEVLPLLVKDCYIFSLIRTKQDKTQQHRLTQGSLSDICNKLALWFLLSPSPMVSFTYLCLTTCALGEKLYNLKLSINLSVKWHRTHMTLPHGRTASGFQTACFHYSFLRTVILLCFIKLLLKTALFL